MTNRKFIAGLVAGILASFLVGIALLAVQAWMTPDATVSHDSYSEGGGW